jgi:hypothetical protein
MFTARSSRETSQMPMLDTAWAILEAANDLRDIATVETCRQVIDATHRGQFPASSDVDVILDFFN